MASFIISTPSPMRLRPLAGSWRWLVFGILRSWNSEKPWMRFSSLFFWPLQRFEHQTSVFQLHLFPAQMEAEVSDLLQVKTSLAFFFFKVSANWTCLQCCKAAPNAKPNQTDTKSSIFSIHIDSFNSPLPSRYGSLTLHPSFTLLLPHLNLTSLFFLLLFFFSSKTAKPV